ncbi:MAG: alpha/beta fold hydrolase [Rhodothermales bacterium]
MASLDLDSTQFEYYEDGSGEPLVFVHGSASDYRTWHGQRDAFAERFRVIDYSRRYHWPNEPIPAESDYSMAEHVDDLRALLHSLDATPAHLVGHSYGAFVCLLLAIEEPRLVRSLVLAEPPVITLFVSNTPKPLELLKLSVTRPRTAAAIVKLGASGLGPATAAARRGDMDEAMRLFGTAALGREAYRHLSEARREQVRVNLIRVEFLGSGFPALEAEPLRGLRIPTLLMTGQASPLVFHRLADRLEELLPETERAEIPGASHIMHEDNAPAYNAAVLAFTAKHRYVV